jgi:hypothetical protein
MVAQPFVFKKRNRNAQWTFFTGVAVFTPTGKLEGEVPGRSREGPRELTLMRALRASIAL